MMKNAKLGKAKADIAFCKKVTLAVQERNWEAVETYFNQYGTYLMLIDSDIEPVA